MPKARRSLDPTLEALQPRQRLESDEIILDWNEGRPGEVVVRLISKKLHRVSAPIAKKFGRGAGQGRSLEFKLQDGKWLFQGFGGWMS